MASQEFCNSCNQKHNCQEQYRQLGSCKGPSIVFKVMVAFILPVVVFTGALAIFDVILAKLISTEALHTAVGFILALSVTVAMFVCCLMRCER